MEFETQYQAHMPDEANYVHFTAEEDQVWHQLITRQQKIIENRACQTYIDGLQQLNFSQDQVPQLTEVSALLNAATGWSVAAVDALIPCDYFFKLLANKQFPAACFVRRLDEIDYLQEPDIFHEYFGHCPLILDPHYTQFMQRYGEIALQANEQQRELLARLYWFTIEFGLIKSPHGLRIYGGGILSSKEETIYALESDIPVRKAFDLVDALRTPYRIDILQPIYFIIDDFQQLFDIIHQDLFAAIEEALRLGEHSPLYPTKNEKPLFSC